MSADPELFRKIRQALTWDKGRQELTASRQGKKAFRKGMGFIPETCQKDLLGKKRMAFAKVIVEHIGGKNYRLTEVEAGTF
jgi:hypothetical protein